MGIAALEVQLAQEYEKMFVGQMTELQTLRSKLDEQQEVNSILEEHLTSAKEIQMTMQQLLNRLVQQVQEQYEEVSTLRDQMHSKYAESNATTLSDCGLSGTARPMDNEEMQEYNEVDVDTEQQHQIEVMPMGIMENEELESMQEHTQRYCETSSTSVVLDAEQQHQSEELPNPRQEANLKQSEDALRTKQVRLELKRTPVHDRITSRNIKSLPFKTTHAEKPTKLNSKLKHVGLKMHDCEECDASFRCKAEMFRHSLIHTGEKPFKCDVCSKSCKLKSNLSRHLLIHRGEKPFTCVVCNQSFRSKFEISQHMKIHTGERCYKCELCDRHFSQKGNLSRHLLIHTDEKPFACDVCKQSFRYKTAISRHMRIHTGERTKKSTV